MNRIKTIAIFLIIILLILFAANLVAYKALSLAFKTPNSFFFLVTLAIGSLCFIASLLLGMRFYNFFTRIYSRLAMVWIGFFAYLFFASIIYLLLYIIIGDKSGILADILFGAAIMVTIYGILHARTFIVKEVLVELKNLSDQWKSKKVVWISDLHIGQIHGKRFVKRIIEKLGKISPDIIFIGGDLFDGIAVEGVLESIEPFRNLKSKHGIYFITGNHEGYANINLFLEKIKNIGIKILHNEMTIIDEMQLIGVDFISTAKEDDFREIITNLNIDHSNASILLKHEPKHLRIAQEAGIAFQISGHTHKAQQWPFEYLARLAYSRFTYGLQKFDSMQVYTSSGIGTWGPPIRVGTDAEIVLFKFK